MVHHEERLPVKSQLSVFSASVFLLLTHTCAGQSLLIGPPQPIVAIVGDDTILPCHLEPAVAVIGRTVVWTRPDLKPSFVHVWREGVDLIVHHYPSYKGRTSLFTDKLKHGDVSLKLSEVKLSDEGKYRCFIPSLGKETSVELVVGQYQLIGPPQPIVVILGDDVTLPCHLEPARDVTARAVEWTRHDLKPSFVHVWREGLELLIDQHPSYKGRTSLFMDKLKHGDVSLKLSEVKLSDEGKYRCFIPSLGKEMTVELVVGAASSPVLNVTKSSSGVVLECESKGWYPEPELFWLDAEGKLLSAGAPETVRGPDGLYTVSSRVTVEKSHSNSFTCRVQQLSINQTRDTHIHFPDDFILSPVVSDAIVRV
ncbi:butyrophilin-like protein 10 [Myripristis murdjan]|uniref:butyrophilin-like protein 10 n=1 Tax=Myripristis murdjan TaxID=586833 RepID=UPI0011761F4B|nr:butyrophilin-like protein 10 [Myripristis murdjan]